MILRGIWKVVGGLLKANLWEVLAIIGVVQIVILPVIAASTRVRTAAWMALRGRPSRDLALVQLLRLCMANQTGWTTSGGLSGQSAWDGGFFGVIGWAIPMLLGTIVYDIMASHLPSAAAWRLFVYGAVLLDGGIRPQLPGDPVRHRQGVGRA